MLWDLPGGGVAPSMAGGDDALDVSTQGYVNSMQLHTMSCVVVVVGLHDTEVALNVVNACHEDHVPLVLVQTHVDELVRDALKKEGRQVDAESLHARLESLLEGAAPTFVRRTNSPSRTPSSSPTLPRTPTPMFTAPWIVPRPVVMNSPPVSRPSSTAPTIVMPSRATCCIAGSIR